MSRGPMPSALSPSTSSCKLTPRSKTGEAPVRALIDVDLGARDGGRVSGGGEGAGLRYLGRLGHADRQVALGDGHLVDADLTADDDDAGLFVDDHARRLIGFDPELLDVG